MYGRLRAIRDFVAEIIRQLFVRGGYPDLGYVVKLRCVFAEKFIDGLQLGGQLVPPSWREKERHCTSTGNSSRTNRTSLSDSSSS